MKKCTCCCYTAWDQKTRKDSGGGVRGCENWEDIGTYLRWEPSSAGTLFCCKKRKLGGSVTRLGSLTLNERMNSIPHGCAGLLGNPAWEVRPT